MKQTIIAILVFFAALFVYTKIAGPFPFYITSTTTQKTDTFTVTGDGKVAISPDMAVVNVGVQSSGTTVKAAQNDLNTKINKVSSDIKKLGIDAKDIQTSNYNISPEYDYGNGKPRITGYQANSTVTVHVKDLDKTNSVIDAATAAGANQVGGISFEVSDKTKALDEARTKAVADAKTKAQDAAKIAGFHLGKIVNYSESTGGEVRPYPMMAMAKDAASNAPTQVEPGSTEIQVTVSLSYSLE